MASRKLAADPTRYVQSQGEDHELDDRPSKTNTAGTETEIKDPTASSTIVRRRKAEARPYPINAMSLVGLKNLFFTRKVTPVPRTKWECAGPFDWSKGSDQPLLPRGDQTPGSATETRTSSETEDIESQSMDSKTEKANQKKGFRIDARIISDATIGLSDGLTVPFALTAGLSALGNTKVVIYGGFAELIAGAISMGLGGYLGAKSEL